MPPRPAAPIPQIIDLDPASPYEKIAVDLRDRIASGVLPAGLPVPPIKQLAREHGVSVSTVQRAVTLLKEWGLVELHSGRRTLVRQLPTGTKESAQQGPDRRPVSGNDELLDLEIRRLGQLVSTVQTESDHTSPAALRRLLVDALRRNGDNVDVIGDYEMVVRHAGEGDVIKTFVAPAR
jgi:integrase